MAGVFQVSTKGKYELFKNGWTTIIAKAELYTENATLVDTQTVAFAYNNADNSLRPTAAIVFEVDSPVNSVAAVYITNAAGNTLFFRELDTYYDFPTEGTLTVESWVLTLTGNIVGSGKSLLWTQGWESLSHYITLLADATVRVASAVDKAFTANASNGKLEMSSAITIEVPASTTGINRVSLRSAIGAVGNDYFHLALGTTYSYTNAGSFKINSFALSIT